MRHLRISSTAVLIIASLSTPVYSAFHLMRINELMLGVGGDCRIQYVELQMTATGQNFVGGTSLFFFDADGNPTGRYRIPGSVANGSRQGGELPYILIGTAEFAAVSDVAPDFADLPAGLLPPEGGRVSFNNASPDFSIDSVAYGAYVGDNGKHGAPAAAPDPLGNESLLRSVSGNDNSASFAVGAPTPTNNDFVTGTASLRLPVPACNHLV